MRIKALKRKAKKNMKRYWKAESDLERKQYYMRYAFYQNQVDVHKRIR